MNEKLTKKKRNKLTKKAAKVLTTLRDNGVTLTYHCEGGSEYTGCWRIDLDGVLDDFAVVGEDGEVWL